jgi:hypothetical protein
MGGISCPKFNKQTGWPRENGAATSLGGSDQSSIWEKARARDRQRGGGR